MNSSVQFQQITIPNEAFYRGAFINMRLISQYHGISVWDRMHDSWLGAVELSCRSFYQSPIVAKENRLSFRISPRCYFHECLVVFVGTSLMIALNQYPFHPNSNFFAAGQWYSWNDMRNADWLQNYKTTDSFKNSEMPATGRIVWMMKAFQRTQRAKFNKWIKEIHLIWKPISGGKEIWPRFSILLQISRFLG